jgi:quercetin dioxygenase-like cupin family protein
MEYDQIFEDVAVALACMVATPPPSGLRKKVLRATRPRAVPEVAPGMFLLRAGEGDWTSTPFAGVEIKLLHLDPKTQVATTLVRMQPGAMYPAHRHSHAEHCYVMEGDVTMGDFTLRAGDYGRAESGTTHTVVRSEGGCVMLIIAAAHDEFVSA